MFCTLWTLCHKQTDIIYTPIKQALPIAYPHYKHDRRPVLSCLASLVQGRLLGVIATVHLNTYTYVAT
jgi:hypothetical protein